MITLGDAIKRLRDRYALRRSDDPDEIVRTFRRILNRDFNGAIYEEYIVDAKMKNSRLILSLTHPLVIQEIKSFAASLTDAVNRDLGESLLLDIDFKVVAKPEEKKPPET